MPGNVDGCDGGTRPRCTAEIEKDRINDGILKNSVDSMASFVQLPNDKTCVCS